MEQRDTPGRQTPAVDGEHGLVQAAAARLAAPGAATAYSLAGQLAERSLEGRLLALRLRARQDCRSATVQVVWASCSLLLLLSVGWVAGLWGLIEGLSYMAQGVRAAGLAPELWQLGLTGIVCVLAPALIYYVFNIARNAPRLAAWAYQDCLRGIVHADYGLLFTDEGLAAALREIQQDHWSQSLLPEAQVHSLERTLELAAQNFPAAQLLPGGSDRLIRGRLLARRWRKRREFFFRLPLPARLLLAAVWPLGLPVGLAGISTLTFLGSDFICARARLLAFLDHCLELPKVDAAALGPPEQPRNWWERLTAPWRSCVRVEL